MREETPGIRRAGKGHRPERATASLQATITPIKTIFG